MTIYETIIFRADCKWEYLEIGECNHILNCTVKNDKNIFNLMTQLTFINLNLKTWSVLFNFMNIYKKDFKCQVVLNSFFCFVFLFCFVFQKHLHVISLGKIQTNKQTKNKRT